MSIINLLVAFGLFLCSVSLTLRFVTVCTDDIDSWSDLYLLEWGLGVITMCFIMAGDVVFLSETSARSQQLARAFILGGVLFFLLDVACLVLRSVLRKKSAKKSY